MMNVLTVLMILAAFIGFAFLGVRALIRAGRDTRPVRPCYRCGVLATTDYMGLHYCLMCRVVIVQMLPAVRHDPPYGFPGASGYLEFRDVPPALLEDRKKEG